jgi:AcrR family transcriptional regulator
MTTGVPAKVKTEHPSKARVARQAMRFASLRGLEGLSISAVANKSDLSKSSIFSHYRSKCDLQIAVLDATQALFLEKVVRPRLGDQPGLPRLSALFHHWLGWARNCGLPGSCPFVRAGSEVVSLLPKVRRHFKRLQQAWFDQLKREVRVAIACGELNAHCDPQGFVDRLFGIYLVHHWHLTTGVDRGATRRAKLAFDQLLAAAAA